MSHSFKQNQGHTNQLSLEKTYFQKWVSLANNANRLEYRPDKAHI